MPGIAANLQAVRARISAAEREAGRKPGEVSLLAVSKMWPIADVRAAVAAGQRAFGENYLQEGIDKLGALADLVGLEWHFIGPVQSNKTRLIAQHFQWVHAIDRLKIAQRLAEQRDVHLPPLQVCLQVNVSGEASKSGIMPSALHELVSSVAVLPRLKLRGLMCIPEPTADQTLLRSRFRLLRELRDSAICQTGVDMDTLSMGMSNDFDV
ncbi:MAG TPA: YggS family pyridoxal phosphate-dependent enzyme, partial [Rhodocyclaceae bacterium]|nr:YggS family pyridoxal phosphate-dependent enzyme [Rhodocyclaceae bacterium]